MRINKHFSESGRVALAVAYCTVFQLTETLSVEMDYYKRDVHSTHLRQFHHISWQHDFAGKGEYNFLRGVSKKWYLLF